MTDRALVVLAALIALAPACRRQAHAPGSQSEQAPRQTPALVADRSRLPEDPVAGKRSEQQWREHMVEEEHERQLMFDRERLKQHRALVKLVASARARYDRARTEAAVAKVRSDMPQRIAEMRRRVTEIDHWGVNSRLLPDYDALETSLAVAYPDAKVAAIRGDAHALKDVRAGFDQHMKQINEWLEEAAESEQE